MNSNGGPSQTALTAAAARAAHLIVDSEPLIFRDTLAYALLGERAEELVGFHRTYGDHLVLAQARTTVVTRGHYTEARLDEAIHAGVRQYVILGAGLDSFAYRTHQAARPAETPQTTQTAQTIQTTRSIQTAQSTQTMRPGAAPPADGVRVFEVDHPATQRWKRRALADAGIEAPPALTFVPSDLEAGPPLEHLAGHGLDLVRPALVGWLGVTMYLTRDAVGRTLSMLAGLAPGSEIIVEHMLPEGLRDDHGQAYADQVMPFAAEHGEPWLTLLSPDEMSAMLRERGFEVIEHVRQREMVPSAMWDRTDALHAADLAVLTRARLVQQIVS